MWAFMRAVEGLASGLRALDVPVVSGNVNLYNETSGCSIQPTPTLGMVGKLSAQVLLGTALPQSGTSLTARIQSVERGAPPKVHWDDERALHRTLIEGIGRGLSTAVHDAAEGGIGVALAEMCLQGGIGAQIQLPVPSDDSSRELALFGETHAAAWVCVDEASLSELLALAMEQGCMARHLGSMQGARLVVRDVTKAVFLDAAVDDLFAAWDGGLSRAVGL